MILMGVAVAGIVKIPLLYQERRLNFIDRPFSARSARF